MDIALIENASVLAQRNLSRHIYININIMSKRTTCGFCFQGHYVYRQIFPNGRYKIMVWVASNPPEEELCADVAFCGDSHVECMDKLKQYLEINKDWVNKTDGNT